MTTLLRSFAASRGLRLVMLTGLFVAGMFCICEAKQPASRQAEHVRAGCPRLISALAAPTNTSHYGGYYVGGGTITVGDGQGSHDGTWGWDYGGILVHKWVSLGWTHGRRHQGGAGAYRTAGPTLLRAQ